MNTETPKAEPPPSKEDADILLCRRIVTRAGKPEAEADCVAVMKGFRTKEDFDKTASELSRILAKPREEVLKIINEEAPKTETEPTSKK